MSDLEQYKVTQNACKFCSPLGASLAFKGLEGAMNLIHGSQGCSTYIRRYMISHFREPIDIASSNFSEDTAIFGGQNNLKTSLKNIILQYNPKIIGISSTCLSETIGDDVNRIINEFIEENKNIKLPYIIPVSTPSYKGTHTDGYYNSIFAIIKYFSQSNNSENNKKNRITLLLPPLSCTDIDHFKEILNDYKLDSIVFPDYSDTLNGTLWESYKKIPPGGTPIKDIKKINETRIVIEIGRIIEEKMSAGKYLNTEKKIPLSSCGIPIGIKENDIFFNQLSNISGFELPDKYNKERSRLIDSYFDGHKVVFGKKACIFGDEDLAVALGIFLEEIGMIPNIIVTGAKTGLLTKKIKHLTKFEKNKTIVLEDSDFIDMEREIEKNKPDLLIGNSKGYKTAKKFNIPLIRAGFPIHDRFGGSRILHIGYRGTSRLFDEIVNTLLTVKQYSNPVGYTYF